MPEEIKHGLSLCCNITPEYTLGIGISSFYMCPVCKKGEGRGGWSRNKPWIASLWNQSNQRATGTPIIYEEAPKLDVGEKWRYAELRFESHLPYGERKTVYQSPFVLFSTGERAEDRWLLSKDNYECVIDDSRCFKQFELRSFDGVEVKFSLPSFKKFTPFSVYLGRSWSTNGTWWYTVNITAYNYKWVEFFTNQLKPIV